MHLEHGAKGIKMSQKPVASWGRKEAQAGTKLPYARLHGTHTLQLRDGSLMQTIAVSGLPFETADGQELDHFLVMRDTLLRTALDSSFVLYHHVIRRRVEVALEGNFNAPFAEHLDRRWNSRLRARKLFVNEQYLSIVRRPPRGKTGFLEKVRGRLSVRNDAVNGEELRELETAVHSLMSGLIVYKPHVLQRYQTPHGECHEVVELLSLLFNGEFQPALVPDEGSDVGFYLPYTRISFGLDAMETKGSGWRDFAGVLGIKEYPPVTRAGLLDGLLRLDSEFVLTETFAPLEKQVARERMDLAVRRLRATDDNTATERREMLSAKDALASGQTSFVDHHVSVLVRAPTPSELDRAIANASAALAETGAIVVREDVNLEPSFWAQFPGNEQFAVRRALISTANAAGFMSLHGFPLGKSEGNHWGEAVCLFETTAGTPYFFNFHAADLGHFTAIGPSGSGKTVAMNFLVAQAQRFRPRTIVFDKDRGSEIFVRALGGTYSRISAGEPTGFNPLALEDSPINRAFVSSWLAVLLQPQSAVESAHIAYAVDVAFQHDRRLRRLRHFQDLLRGRNRPSEGDLASRLAPWIGDGPHAWLFDNESDVLDLEKPVTGFDMTELLDAPTLRTPTMMYLFHRIDQRLDGHPTIIIVDEGWKALDDPVFVARLRDWLKTLRKRNAVVGFGTQSASDALESRISSAIIEQTATQIFTPNAKARHEDYCDGFGLTEHELELIRSLPASGNSFLIRHANHSVVVRLPLNEEKVLLKVLSGREANVRHLDMLRSAHGDDPRAWFEKLTGAPWCEGQAA